MPKPARHTLIRRAAFAAALALHLAFGAGADAQRARPLPAPEAPGAQRVTTRLSDRPEHPEQVFSRTPAAALLFRHASNTRPAAAELRLLRDYAFDGALLVAHDIDGRPLIIPLDRIGALVCSPLRAAPPRPNPDSDKPKQTGGPRGVLVLIDGQRLAGRLLPGAGADDEIAWRCDLLGAIAAPLDAVASLHLGDAGHVPHSGRHAVDELTLANGDTLFGTVISIDTGFTIDTGGAELALPPERITHIRFANPAIESTGPIAWLSGGGAARLAAIHESPARAGRADLRLTLTNGRTGDAPRAALLALTGADTTLVPLSSLELIEHEPDADAPLGARRPAVETPDPWSPFALAGARDITIPGSAKLGYQLPQGARLLTGVVAAPQRGWRWSDAVVTIWIDRRPAARLRIDQSRPESEFIIPIAPGSRELLITLSPGAAGEAQAFAVLRTPMLTVDTK